MDEEVKIEGNIDINQALQEFEAKSNQEQAERLAANAEVPEISSASKMVKLVMKLSGGAIKEERQAEYVLLGFAIIAFTISFFLFFGNPFASPNRKIIPPLPPQVGNSGSQP